MSMAAKWIETLVGSLEQKKQYRQHMARIDALPEPYRSAAKALQRYFMYQGGILLDGGTPVRAIVGDDPVEFAETFVQAYSGKQWQDKERERLRKAIDAAAGDNGEEKSA
jgi:DNA-binding ferritin-like protein (Dps family)